MTKSKSTPIVKEVDAVVDTAYQGYITQAVALTRHLEVSNLEWQWKVGEIFHSFLSDLDSKKIQGRSVDHFTADMLAQGVPLGESSAYAARQIHLNYRFEVLPAMVSAGVTFGHLKVLGPLAPEVRQKVEKHMLGTDGKVISIRDLEGMIRDTKVLTASTDAKKALAAPAPKGKDEPSAKARDTAKEVTFVDSSGDDEDTPEADGNAPLATPAKADHRTVSEKEFSASPLKAFKKLDKHLIAATASIADALIASNEGVKIGFNSDRARENFLEGLNGIIGTSQGLYDALGPLLKRLKESRDNV